MTDRGGEKRLRASASSAYPVRRTQEDVQGRKKKEGEHRGTPPDRTALIEERGHGERKEGGEKRKPIAARYISATPDGEGRRGGELRNRDPTF